MHELPLRQVVRPEISEMLLADVLVGFERDFNCGRFRFEEVGESEPVEGSDGIFPLFDAVVGEAICHDADVLRDEEAGAAGVPFVVSVDFAFDHARLRQAVFAFDGVVVEAPASVPVLGPVYV